MKTFKEFCELKEADELSPNVTNAINQAAQLPGFQLGKADPKQAANLLRKQRFNAKDAAQFLKVSTGTADNTPQNTPNT